MPNATPVTRPEDTPIVATAVLPLLHVPPPELVNVIVPPAHTTEGPDIADGNGSTVTTVVIAQPDGGV